MRPYKVICVNRDRANHAKTEYKAYVTYANDKRKAVSDIKKLMPKNYSVLSVSVYSWNS